jgi:hypothetical protein
MWMVTIVSYDHQEQNPLSNLIIEENEVYNKFVHHLL